MKETAIEQLTRNPKFLVVFPDGSTMFAGSIEEATGFIPLCGMDGCYSIYERQLQVLVRPGECLVLPTKDNQ